MNVIITKKFKDKHTKQWHEMGEQISVTPERYEEIKTACRIVEKSASFENTSVEESTEKTKKSIK